MGQYSKSIAAAIGLVALFLKDAFNIELPSETWDNITNGLMSLGTLFGVYQLSNKKMR